MTYWEINLEDDQATTLMFVQWATYVATASHLAYSRQNQGETAHLQQLD